MHRPCMQSGTLHLNTIDMPAGQSVKHHLLSNYYHAILAVVLAQFSNRGFIDGMAGIVRLAEASSYFQVWRLTA